MFTSEVNTFIAKSRPLGDNNGTVMSSFIFSLPNEFTQGSQSPKYDEDGDLIREDDRTEKDFILEIEHCLQTNLASVGQQVWRGALFMADYVLDNTSKTKDKTVLEVGAGTGITSIILAKFCDPRQVLVTDIQPMLPLLSRNLTRSRATKAQPMELDLTIHPNAVIEPFLKDVDIVIGADIIYDNDITDGIVEFLKTLFEQHPKSQRLCLLTIEKRYIFTLDDLDTVAPSFEYFMSKLDDLQAELDQKLIIDEFSIVDVKQSFCYERSDDLTLISIRF